MTKAQFILLLVPLLVIFLSTIDVIYNNRMQHEALCGDPEDLKETYIKWNRVQSVYCSNGNCTSTKTPSDSTNDALPISFYSKIFYFWIGLVVSIPFLLVATQLEKRRIRILSPFLEFAIETVYFCLQFAVEIVVSFLLLLGSTCVFYALLFTSNYLIYGTSDPPTMQLHSYIKVAFIESRFPHAEIDCSAITPNEWIPAAISSITFLVVWFRILSLAAAKISWILSAETVKDKMGVLLYWFALGPAVLTIGNWCATYFGFSAPVSGTYKIGFILGWIYAAKTWNVVYPKLKKSAEYFRRKNESLPALPVLLAGKEEVAS